MSVKRLLIDPNDYTIEEVNILATKFNLGNYRTSERMADLFCEALTLADKAIRELRKLKLGAK